ncbi:MAG: hypothetical protein GY771_17185 [bacterium]|nr:hypothetical protein [bacterium]
MKTISYFTFAIVALTGVAFATVYGDDFEGYPVGYDIADSPDWTCEDYGQFVIRQQIGNKYIENDNLSSPMYLYEPSGVLVDALLSFDFMFTDEETQVQADIRYNPTGQYRGYSVIFGNEITTAYGTEDYLIFAYRIGNDVIIADAEGIFPIGSYFGETTWYYCEITIRDTYPINFEIRVNDDLYRSGSIEYPVTDSGYYGLSTSSYGHGPIGIDNFEVDDDPVFTGIESASLGEIKASFR